MSEDQQDEIEFKCPPKLCSHRPGRLVFCAGMSILTITSLIGAVWLSYIGVSRASDPKMEAYCSQSYTYEGYVTNIVQAKDYDDYKVWMNIYQNGWQILRKGQWFLFNNQTLHEYSIPDYLNTNDSLPVYKKCSYTYYDSKFHLQRQHQYYNITSYVFLSIFSIVVGIACLIGFVVSGISCIVMEISAITTDIRELESFEEL